MTEIALRKPWDMQTGETAKAFQAFSIYRDLGPNRTVSKAALALGKSTSTLDTWYVRNGWKARADAWDYAEDLKAQARREERIRKAEEREHSAAQLATSAGLVGLAGRKAGVGEDGTIHEAVEPLMPKTAAEAAQLLTVGLRNRRLLDGQPTDLSRAMNDFSMAEVTAIVTPIVEAALARLPEEEHESYIREVREIGLRATSR